MEAYFSKIVSIREEGLDAQHGNQIQQNQLHVNAQINPATLKKKKKTLLTTTPLNHVHKGHRSYFTILKMAAGNSTIILPLPPN